MTLAPARPVPNLTGETRVGDTIAAVAPDTKRSAEFTALFPQRIVKLTVACDGAGGAPPTLKATVRGVIYQASVLLATSDEVVVTSGDPLQWIDLPFTVPYPGGVQIAAGEVEFGVIVGGDPSVLRVAQIDPDAPLGGGRTNADPYSDGALNPYGSYTPISATMSIFGTASPTWVPRDNIDFDVIAKLGFLDAQALLAGTLDEGATYETTIEWHGTKDDPNRGSFAIVLAGGSLASLVGERILVTSKTHATRSVYVYVTAAVTTLDSDMSLARRAFAELDLLSADTLDVHVDVLAS